MFLRLFSKIPPFTVARAFGPMAPLFLRTARRDIVGKFESAMEDRHKYAISEYIYHCNSYRNTGESAFHRLLSNGPWPINPIIDRMIENLHIDIPLTFVYGAKSWLDFNYGAQIKESRPNSYTHIEVISSAGHKVFSDDEVLFNSIVLEACKVLKSYNRI
jgi:abhydrolase domain-containing protein 5